MIREHLRGHNIKLQIERDVAWQEHEPPGARIQAHFASPSGPAGFWCGICGRRTIVGEALPGPARTARQLRKSPALASILRGTDPDQLDSLLAAHERGELAPAQNEERLRRAAQRSQGKRRRAANVRRREACQKLLLRLMSEINHREAAAEILHKALRDEESCIKATGMRTPPSEATLMKYWSGREDSVPLAKRNAAKAAYLRQPEARRAQTEKERRLGTLAPPPYLTG